MHRAGITIVTAGVAVLAFLTGCAATTAGNAVADQQGSASSAIVTPSGTSATAAASTTPPASSATITTSVTTTGPTTSSSCQVVYSDPSIAFEPSLSDGDVLAVGDTGWISGAESKDDVTFTGTPGAVTLADRSIESFRSCDHTSTVSWVEVKALAAGSVTLTVGKGNGKSVHITVRES